MKKANTSQSKKQKGKRLELLIAREWRKKIDGFAITTPGSGSGKFKSDIYNKYYQIEAKNQETVKLWQWWDQANSQKQFNKPPVLAISGNYRPVLVCMELCDWLDLVKEAKIEH